MAHTDPELGYWLPEDTYNRILDARHAAAELVHLLGGHRQQDLSADGLRALLNSSIAEPLCFEPLALQAGPGSQSAN